MWLEPFSGYMEIAAPPEDDARPKWQGILSTMSTFNSDVYPATVDAGGLEAFNVQINDLIEYKFDPMNVWRTPAQTLSVKTGECIDYATLKFAILQRFPQLTCCVCLGEIAAMPQNKPHAFLIVSSGENRFILDSEFNQLLTPANPPQFTTKGLDADYINWLPIKLLYGDGTVTLLAETIVLAGKGPQ